jgi:hypothetical protein
MNSLTIDDFARSNQELGIQKWDTVFHEYIGSDKKLRISCTVTLYTADGHSSSYTSIASPENCGGKDDKETLRSYAEEMAYSEAIHRLRTLIKNDSTNYNKSKQQNQFFDGYPSDAYSSVKSAPPANSNGNGYNHSKNKSMSDKQKGMILGRCKQHGLNAEQISKKICGQHLENCSSYDANEIIKHITQLDTNDDY